MGRQILGPQAADGQTDGLKECGAWPDLLAQPRHTDIAQHQQAPHEPRAEAATTKKTHTGQLNRKPGTVIPWLATLLIDISLREPTSGYMDRMFTKSDQMFARDLVSARSGLLSQNCVLPFMVSQTLRLMRLQHSKPDTGIQALLLRWCQSLPGPLWHLLACWKIYHFDLTTEDTFYSYHE